MRQKHLHRSHCIKFVWAIHWWAWDLPSRVVCTPSKTPVEKTNIFFASSQLEKASCLGMGALAHIPFSAPLPYLAWMCVGPMRAATDSVSSCTSASSCLEGSVSLVLSISSGANNLSKSLSPESWGERFVEDIPLRIECSKVSHSPSIVLLWVLVPTHSGEKFIMLAGWDADLWV